MATMTFKAGDEYALRLSKYAANQESLAGKAIHAGAAIVADAIRGNLSGLPEEKYQYLTSGKKHNVLSRHQKDDLLNGLGITPMAIDKNGDWNVKIGFDGYGSYPSKRYPQGLPNSLLARSIESGSSVRHKSPFVRPAVQSKKKQAQEAMARVIDDETKRMM